MARKGSRDTAPVTTEKAAESQPVEAVVTEAPVQSIPEYIPHPCIYGLFVNNKVVFQEGKAPEIQGKWYVEYVDTSDVATCYGPYPLYDNTGQPLVGFVPLDLLKDIARQMWNGNLGNYQAEPFQLMSAGMKIMSCMIFITD